MHQEFDSSLLEQIPGLVTINNINTGQYFYVNRAVRTLLGYSQEEFIEGGLKFSRSIIHTEDLQEILNSYRQVVNAAKYTTDNISSPTPIVNYEYRIRHKNGDWKWLHTSTSIFQNPQVGPVEYTISVSMDITERIKTETNLKYHETNFKNLVEIAEDYATFGLNSEGRVISWNKGIEFIFGYTEQEVLKKFSKEFYTITDQTARLPEQEQQKVIENGSSVQEVLQTRKDGGSFHAIISTAVLRDSNGNITGFSKIIRDVTEKKEAEETIRYQAYHDTLTGLANRKAFEERFKEARSRGAETNKKLAIIFLDLDRFKNINDTLGHGVGDSILKEVAVRLTKVVSKTDLVARLGGDEFILLLSEFNKIEEITTIAEKIINSFTEVFHLPQHKLHLSASFGIAVCPTDGADIDTLLKNADTSMYQAKEAGRNRFRFYNQSMNMQSAIRLSLEQDLRNAVDNEQLQIVYQRFVEIQSGKVVGVEALLRWIHPKLGTLFPKDFISLAEEIGMIIPIGNWVLKTVCAQAQEWHNKNLKLQVSVNLSANQLTESNIVEEILRILKDTKFDPNYLELEITESVAMENIFTTMNKLQELKNIGISIAIDDFGTGYSSLSYLKRFPVHKLKIDKSFIKNAISDTHDSAIIGAIISMSKSLGLKVCAEGVESREQLELLRSFDCEIAQGYFICKPLTAEKFIYWLG